MNGFEPTGTGEPACRHKNVTACPRVTAEPVPNNVGDTPVVTPSL